MWVDTKIFFVKKTHTPHLTHEGELGVLPHSQLSAGRLAQDPHTGSRCISGYLQRCIIIMLFLWVIKHCRSIYNDNAIYINKSLRSNIYTNAISTMGRMNQREQWKSN